MTTTWTRILVGVAVATGTLVGALPVVVGRRSLRRPGVGPADRGGRRRGPAYAGDAPDPDVVYDDGVRRVHHGAARRQQPPGPCGHDRRADQRVAPYTGGYGSTALPDPPAWQQPGTRPLRASSPSAVTGSCGTTPRGQATWSTPGSPVWPWPRSTVTRRSEAPDTSTVPRGARPGACSTRAVPRPEHGRRLPCGRRRTARPWAASPVCSCRSDRPARLSPRHPPLLLHGHRGPSTRPTTRSSSPPGGAYGLLFSGGDFETPSSTSSSPPVPVPRAPAQPARVLILTSYGSTIGPGGGSLFQDTRRQGSWIARLTRPGRSGCTVSRAGPTGACSWARPP